MRLLFVSIFVFLFFSLSYSQEIPKPKSQSKFVYRAKDRRDILLSLVDSNGNLINMFAGLTKTGPQQLALEAIIYSPQKESLAVISGDVYRVNEYVGNYKVIKIEMKKVVLERRGKEYELSLEEE